MAILQDQNQTQNQNQGNYPNQPVAGTSAPSGATGTSQGGASQTASPVQQNQAPTQNQGYTDVSSYLNANQAGAQQLGNQVASNLTNQYNTTKGGIDTSAQAATTAANNGYTQENTDLIKQVAANPTAAAADQNQLSAFQGQLNNTYSGPSNWADMGTQQGNVASAQQTGNLINTPGGLNVLAGQVENSLNPGQTNTGINNLDAMLLGGNPDAVNSVKAASDPFSTLNDYINQQNTSVTGAINQGQTVANQTAQDALNAFTGANGTYTNLNNQVNTETANALAQAQAQQAQLKTDLSGLETQGSVYDQSKGLTNYNVGQLSPQDIQAMGMTQDQANALTTALQNAGTSQYSTGHNFGASSQTGKSDLLSYLTQQDPTAMINAGTVATPEEYQQMAAIQQLLGSQTPQGAAINPLNASQAGTYNPANLNQFNYGAATSDAQNFADQARAAAQQQANKATSDADLAHAQSQHGSGFVTGINNLGNSVLGKSNQGPQFSTGNLAHGGEVQDVSTYLDKNKKVK